MNAPDPLARESFASLLARARDPFPASRKAYIQAPIPPNILLHLPEIPKTIGNK